MLLPVVYMCTRARAIIYLFSLAKGPAVYLLLYCVCVCAMRAMPGSCFLSYFPYPFYFLPSMMDDVYRARPVTVGGRFSSPSCAFLLWLFLLCRHQHEHSQQFSFLSLLSFFP